MGEGSVKQMQSIYYLFSINSSEGGLKREGVI